MASGLSFVLNGVSTRLPASVRGQRLLFVLRDHLGLTGTKFGCGVGLCGACTVHIDGVAQRSCVTLVDGLEGRRVTTIEGLASQDRLHPVQEAWLAERVPQCGYCQAGQIMTAAALLAQTPNPDSATIRTGMAGNLCRCGTYGRVERAVARAAAAAEGRRGVD